MKRNVFITVCIAIAVSTGIFFSQGGDKQVEEPVNNKLPKAQRIDEALEWRKELLADPATGEFDVNLLYTALAKADELKSHTHTGSSLAAGTIWLARYQLSGGTWPNERDGNTSGTGSPTGATGGTETRPRNVALLACIKY